MWVSGLNLLQEVLTHLTVAVILDVLFQSSHCLLLEVLYVLEQSLSFLGVIWLGSNELLSFFRFGEHGHEEGLDGISEEPLLGFLAVVVHDTPNNREVKMKVFSDKLCLSFLQESVILVVAVSKYEYHHAVDKLTLLGLAQTICREDILTEYSLDKLLEETIHLSLWHVCEAFGRYARNHGIVIYFPVIEFGILILVKFVHVSKASSRVEEIELLVRLVSLTLHIGFLGLDLLLFRSFETRSLSLLYGQNFLLNRLRVYSLFVSLLIRQFIFKLKLFYLMSGQHLRNDTSGDVDLLILRDHFLIGTSIFIFVVIFEMWYKL